MLVYMEVGQCRRVVLDRVMDGEDRSECLEDEVACDVCQAVRGLGPEGSERQEEERVIGEEEVIIFEEREGNIDVGAESRRREAVRRYSWESEDEGDEGSEHEEDKDEEDEDEEDEDEEEGEGSNDGVWENDGTEDSEAVEKERNNIEGKIGAEEIQDFVEARIERVWEMGQEVKERREIYKKVGDFQEQLASWVRCYVICRFSGAGRSEWYYEKEECK